MMTFQDYNTYNWYLKDVPSSCAVILDTSELPDKVEEVQFWRYYVPGMGAQMAYYAIGKVTIGD
jgi:hypothetical protein